MSPVVRLARACGEKDWAAAAQAALELAANDGGSAAGFDIISPDDLWAPLPAVPWLLKDLDVAPGAPTLVAGFGFAGKSLALQSLAISVAAGIPAWGRFPVRQGKVVHADYEQGSRLTRDRYQRLARGLGIAPERLRDSLAVAALPRVYVSSPRGETEIRRVTEGAALCIIDSFRAACPDVDENSSEARRPLDALNRVSEDTGCVFAVIHHARKPSEKDGRGGARMAIRGSGALYDAPGSVIVFSGEKGEPVLVQHEKARTSGILREDFALRIQDTENGGVTVVAEDVPSKEEKARASRAERAQRIESEILAYVALNPGATVRGIRGNVGGDNRTIDAALDKLARDQRIDVVEGVRGARACWIRRTS